MDISRVMAQNPLLAILRNVPLDKTEPYAGAVVKGGVCFFEVALNSPHALEQIALLRKRFGDDCLVGAGTAITVEKAKAALDAGAQFLLTPGTPVDVLEYCAQNEVALLPGVLTPTDVAVCLEYGFKTMKLFPAGAMPHSYVKDLKGPFDGTNYMAIGGVNRENAAEFLAAGYSGVGLASGLMPPGAAERCDWQACADGVRALRQAVEKATGKK